MIENQTRNRRILIVDDNPAIHDDFGKILASETRAGKELFNDLESQLFGSQPPEEVQFDYQVDSAFQGEDGCERVSRSIAAKQPYAMAFVDMRMPPGCDGVAAIERMWGFDENLQVVVCTAYSDYSWSEMVQRLGRTDRLLILKKPFDNVEVCQLALALTEKYHLRAQAKMRTDDLKYLVEQRTAELLSEIDERKRVEQELLALSDLLQHQASHDSVTGVWNRQAIVGILQRITDCRPARDVSLLFIDVDFFKQVNDDLGHQAGDVVLKEVASRLQAPLPATAALGRYGGEEFLVVLPDAGPPEAEAMAERLRLAVGDSPIPCPGGDRRVTVSLGLAAGNSEVAAEPLALIRQADLALYDAKRLGRNQVAVWPGAIAAI